MSSEKYKFNSCLSFKLLLKASVQIMTKMLTILFASLESVGHVNACIGLAERLRDRGHKIVFAIDNSWKGKLVSYGFIEELFDHKKNEFEKPGEQNANLLLQFGFFSQISSFEKMKILLRHDFFSHLIDGTIENEPRLKSIIERHKPDLYIVDNVIGSPSLIYSDKPWVFLVSTNPLVFLDDDRTPPAFSGFATNGDKKEWTEFRKLSRNVFQDFRYNDWLQKNGYPRILDNKIICQSPFLNIYGYPEELDYTDLRPIPENWCRVDTFIRKEEQQQLVLPKKLSKSDQNNSSSKLIYFSLGSMASADVNLMKRLIAILANSLHKFIVSKGPLHDQFELADNMWGERYVPQTKVLPLVDLVITHGGNNTVAETFSFGKPMIVMPLYADQYDNAQRIHEKGFGIRLDPYNCTEEELFEAIDKLLNDDQLKKRLSLALDRMKKSESLIKAVQRIESLVNKA